MSTCDISGSIKIQSGVAACPQCGSTALVGRGLCLHCMLLRGLNSETETAETLEEVLDEIDVRDADWRIGNYQILEEIGRGGMGVIYRARQRLSQRIVALKRILSYQADSHQTLVRFRREAEAAASLDHPNILPIYEVSESEDGLPFFSMKFASGGSLSDSAKSIRKDSRRIISLMAKVTRAVQYAHVQGILHRDLKPGNILLDGRGEPLVSDFGLAKWLDTSSDLTRTLTIFGTPGYIAPEQARTPAKSLTPAADIYSLGAVLFDLFTGRTPFLGEHALAVIKQATEKPAPKLRTLAPLADRDVETICAKCLEREPQARYRSAGDLAEDLERWLEGRPIIARPVPAPVRLWRWSKRNPKLAGSVAACLVAVAAAVVWQLQSRDLAATVRDEQIAAHSVTVLPFLNLDNVKADADIARALAGQMSSNLSIVGRSKIIVYEQASPRWTGAGTAAEIQFAARQTQCRSVLWGTIRHVSNGLRVSVHLQKENGTDMLAKWIFEAADSSGLIRAMRDKEVPSTIYSTVGAQTPAQSPTADPIEENDTAREYLKTGRQLMDRRTIPDMDRAIASLEAAVRSAPGSASAYSTLSMAYLGRNYLVSSPEFLQHGQDAARKAVSLAPEDPSVNRAMCFLSEARFRYRDALEFGLRALEFGDQSERAFGQIAYAWRMLGRPDLAILWYQKAKVSRGQPADYEALLGDCYTDLGLDDDARLAYEAAANFHPDLPEGEVGLCRLELLTGNFNAARAIYERALQTHTGSPYAREVAALVEFFARNFSKAEKLYSELFENNPQGGTASATYGAVDFRSALARLYLEKGDRDTAEQLSRKSIETSSLRLKDAPESAEAHYALAAANAVIGNRDQALENLKAAVDAGWLDYRSMSVDPRFDRVSETSEFRNLISQLTARAATLAHQNNHTNQK
jgi:tetratricopeptide (TPR) repeat protein/tRNA A-37 threonylcarbamoyl transferase component Bud32/TolB-like protein